MRGEHLDEESEPPRRRLQGRQLGIVLDRDEEVSVGVGGEVKGAENLGRGVRAYLGRTSEAVRHAGKHRDGRQEEEASRRPLANDSRILFRCSSRTDYTRDGIVEMGKRTPS